MGLSFMVSKLFSNKILLIAILVFMAVLAYQSNGARLPNLADLRLNLSTPPAPQKEIIRDVVREESKIIDVVKKTGPSVVSIGVSRRVFNPFDDFPRPKTQESGIGTGFIISADGIIVTNAHVVSDEKAKYTVVTKDNKKLDVQKIYRDPSFDFAIIKVASGNLAAAELGDSDNLQVGQTVIAIGNALGKFDNTVTTGVISGLGRGIEAGDPFSGALEKLENVIQTDAAINPGNSGGPLLDLSGKVIGINTAIASAQNIGFAIPINAVKSTIEDFLATGKISRPYLGVRYVQITRDLAVLNEIPVGVYIQEVLAGSPAEKAGVRDGDIITRFDGKSLDEKNSLSSLIRNRKIGNSIRLTIFRDDKTFDVTATLAESPQ